MAKILAPPMTQFVDANGHPYAGGTVETYIPGTTTAKNTWSDHGATALNTNPVVLDASGRAFILGDGEYRLIVRDALGNLVYDGWTTSLVSTAMQPVIIAATTADAVALLGIADMITSAVSTETSRAETAEAGLQTQITNEVNRAVAAENSLRTDLNAEIARAEAAEAALRASFTATGRFQIYTAHTQDTTLTITVPSTATAVRVTLNANAGSADDVGGWTNFGTGDFLRDGVLINRVGQQTAPETVGGSPPPVFPPPPAYPLGPFDYPGTGSHTYTMHFYSFRSVSGEYIDWPSTMAGNAYCYILLELA